MSHHNNQLMKRIDFFISHKATGTPKQLAKKLNISEREVYYLMQTMKEDYNAPIEYDKQKQTYFYCTNGSFFIGFLEK
jgi:hypothetical protein